MSSIGIPSFNLSGVIPPYQGVSPAGPSLGMAPYRTTVDEFVPRFSTSADRVAILQGFLRFRQRLRGLGLEGWHWLDGSFLENIELLEGRAPRDIDVVTFSFRPPSVRDQSVWVQFVGQNQEVFNPDQAKANFRCDARFVELDHGPYEVVSQSRYWYGLFSHQRTTEVWKGMLEIALPPADVDVQARAVLGI